VIAGKVERKTLRSLPVGTHGLLQIGIEREIWLRVERAHNTFTLKRNIQPICK